MYQQRVAGTRWPRSQTKDHLAELIGCYGQVANSVRGAIDETHSVGDADTADLLTAFSRVLVCAANTSRIWQVTGGPWYRLYKCEYGILQLGAQLSYTRRNIFSRIGGSPSTDDLMLFTSLRYYPF
jgi:hypothetical protein